MMSVLKPYQLFLAVIAVALYLRLCGMWFGLPYVLNPNEADYVGKIFYLYKHFLNPHTATVPGLFLYLNLLVTIISNGTFDINSLISHLEVSPNMIYIPLRLVSLIFGIGAIIILYFIGSMFSTLAGLLASGFLSVSLIHVAFSQMFLPFSAMVFFSLASTFFALKTLSCDEHRHFTASIVFAALSTGMHYIGFVSVIPILFVMALKKDFSKLKPTLIKFCVLFFLLNLYSVFHVLYSLPGLIRNYFLSYRYHHSGSYLLYLLKFLPLGVGPVVWLSAFSLLKYKKNYDLNVLRVVFSLPIFYFALLGLFHLTGAGYAVLIVPYFCLASALVFNSLLLKIESEEKKAALIVLLLFAFYVPLKYTLKYNKIMGLSDTRVTASEWVNENTSEKFKIVWDKNSIQINPYDPYDKNDLKSVLEDPLVLRTSRRFNITPEFLKKKNWFELLRRKVDYAVINSLDYEEVLREKDKTPLRKYYLQILRLKPIIVFNPYLLEKEKKIRSLLLEDSYLPFDTLWQRERAGPLIKIYKL